jgi:hypothetical protein
MIKPINLPILTEKHKIVAKTLSGDYVMLRFDGMLFIRMRRGKTSRIKKKPHINPS